MSPPTLPERLLPPGTRQGFPVMAGALPIIGHSLVFHKDVPGSLSRARAALGPVFWITWGLGNFILLCAEPSAFELLRHPAVVNAGARPALDTILGRSLLSTDGAEHRRVRAAMNPSFSPKGLAEGGAGAIVAEVVTARAERWARLERVAVGRETRELALDVIFRITGVGQMDLPAWHRQYSELLLSLLPVPWDLPWSPRRRSRRAAAWVNREIRLLIERAREEEGRSITHALARARDEAGAPLSTEELVDNIRVLFLAGHETTATTTAFAILELSQRPALWERLVAEASAGAGVPRSLAEAREFPFCEAIFRESVRLYGPAWFLERRLREDLEWEGQRLPAGTALGLSPALWARDEQRFPDPEEFRPDRWIGHGPPSAYDLSPFGGGAHFCLGYSLAWLEVVAFLVALGRATGPGRSLAPVGRLKIEPRYMPILRPPSRAKVHFSGGGALGSGGTGGSRLAAVAP